MSQLPSGTVTFFFTDIEGSTKRWETHPTQMRAALAQHDAILRCAIEGNGGCIFKTVGDAFCSAFSSPYDALSAALDVQRALDREDWPVETGAVKVRAALHTGAVDVQGGDYFGQPVNRVARLLSAGHGGQTLLSMATQELVRDGLPPAVQLVDMGQHRLKDLIRPEHIFQLQAEGLPGEFPPLKTLDNRPNNLPEQLTPFIGREREVKAVSALLRDPGVRLVTLTGTGGTGKTRVALQVAAELLDGYPDGTWFVDLSPITDSALVISRVAQALGVREVAGSPLIDTLKNHLKDKRLLLILDNFEQVLDASGTITDILRSAATINVLVTSRVKLNVYGEHDYEIPPLSVPDAREGRIPPLEKLNQYEAVRLFIERAQAVKADFQVTNDNAPAVAEICVRLDGLPLAIELAAARVMMLPPQALLSRLSERLKLLTGGSRDLPARHQTLRGAIGWSYDLLSKGEQQLFARMAVFNGGRTIEALEEVCNYDGQLQEDVLDGVQSLIDESLLQEREGRNGEPRFWMLETIHEYAREKLTESGESDALRRRHARYFLSMAEEAETHLSGHGQQAWLDRLEDEYDNLRSALRWAKESYEPADIEAGLRAASALQMFWMLRGHYTEGRAHLQDLLEEAGHTQGPSKQSRAKALNAASNLAYQQGDQPAAQPLAEEALRLARETGDKASIARALHNLGLVECNPRKARSIFEESLLMMRELGDQPGIASTLNCLGFTTLMEGDFTGARTLYEESLAEWRELGNRAMVAWQLVNIGLTAADQGDLDDARALIGESLAISKELGERENICSCTAIMGNLAVAGGDYSGARALYEESLAMAREMGITSDIALALTGKGHLAYAEGDCAAASAFFEEVAALNRDMGDQANAVRFSGLASSLRGEYETALSNSEQALALSVKNQCGAWIYETLAQLGSVFVGMGQIMRGAVLLGAAEGVMDSLGGAMCAPWRTLFQRAKDTARARLGEEAFEKAWQEGLSMSLEDAVEYAKEEVQPPQPGPSIQSRAKALNVESYLAYAQSDLSVGQSLAGQALALAREAGDRANIANALNQLGNINSQLGNDWAARAQFEESLTIRRDLGDKTGVARSLLNLASLATEDGDYRTAGKLLEKSLALCKELGDRSVGVSVTECMGALAIAEGDYKRAHALLDECLAVSREMGLKMITSMALLRMGNLASAEGDYPAAAAFYEEGADLQKELGDALYPLHFWGMAASLRGEYARARALHQEALAQCVEGHHPRGVAESMGLLGANSVDMGQVRGGAVLLGAADGLISGLGTQICLLCRVAYRGGIARARSELGEAEFEKAWQEGQAMTEAQAVAYALEGVPAVT